MKWRTYLVLTLLVCASFGPGAAAQDDGTPTLVEGNTAFAFDLYSAIRQDTDGNLLISPYSISQALAMTYAGASGNTAAQMADTLHFGLPQAAVPEAFGALNADLLARGNAAADAEPVVSEGGALVQQARGLQMANGLWGEATYPFSPAYSAELAQHYGVGLQLTDFASDPEAAREAVNAWVAEQTNERIQDIVPQGAITPRTQLLLANAIWFSGGWYNEFDPDATEDGDFFLVDGTSVTVPFMVQETFLDYARGDDFQVVELSYIGSGFAFTVILPDEGRFDEVEAGLDANALAAAIGQLESTKVVVYLPKFTFDYEASLVEPLQTLGLVDAFDPQLADFSGMIEPGAPPDTAPLAIDDVLHKAFISVDEEGTEAAAATTGAMPVGSPVVEPPELRIDRAFLFLIRDTQTGTILFLGRVMDPSVTVVAPQRSPAPANDGKGGHGCPNS